MERVKERENVNLGRVKEKAGESVLREMEKGRILKKKREREREVRNEYKTEIAINCNQHYKSIRNLGKRIKFKK